jgi:hypothetical protein
VRPVAGSPDWTGGEVTRVLSCLILVR